MASEVMNESVAVKRVECIASRDSSFYTLSNRIIVPMLYISGLTLVTVPILPIIITLTLIVTEIVIRYIFKTTLKNALRSLWNIPFGTKRKLVKN